MVTERLRTSARLFLSYATPPARASGASSVYARQSTVEGNDRVLVAGHPKEATCCRSNPVSDFSGSVVSHFKNVVYFGSLERSDLVIDIHSTNFFVCRTNVVSSCQASCLWSLSHYRWIKRKEEIIILKRINSMRLF